MFRYVLSADHQVMYSVVHEPLTICDLINWWAHVNEDVCIQATEEYVQLIDLRQVDAVHVNAAEIRNFLSRVSERPQFLPRRSAIWCKRGMIDVISSWWELPTFGLTNEIMAFTSLDLACLWVGTTRQQVRMAKTLFEPADRLDDIVC